MMERQTLRQQPSPRTRMGVSLLVVLVSSILVVPAEGRQQPWRRSPRIVSQHKLDLRESWRSTTSILSPVFHYRGGANLRNDDDSEEEESESEDEEGASDSEDSESSSPSSTAPRKPSSSSAPPLTITIQTSMGNALLDESMEIPAFPRQKTVRAVKESIARRFSGKPPLDSIQLLHDGILLDDDTMALDELVDDDDAEDDEDEDEEGSSRNKLTLHLDIVPTVDPKTFLVELDTKLADATTSELLDAFVLNEAALHHNYAALEGAVFKDDDDEPVTQHIKDRAAAIRSRLEATLLGTDHAQTLLAESLSPNDQALVAPTLIERKGHRIRTPHASNHRVRRSIQQYLNVDWATLLKHTLLCFFFGTFGGKNKLLLFSLAPVLILLQTRPVKSFLKHTLYALGTDPPGILLSLLPAPHQAILSFRGTDTLQALYGEHIVVGDAAMEQEDDDEDAFFFDAEQFEGSDDESSSTSSFGEAEYDEDDEEWSVADNDEDYDDDDEYDDSDDGDY